MTAFPGASGGAARDDSRPAPAITGAAPSRDLLSRVLSSKPGPERDGARRSLDGFLAETDPARALAAWLALTGRRADSGGAAFRRAVAVDVAAIDRALGAQVDAILHHPRFQRLEATWRGLRTVVEQVDPSGVQDGPPVKVRLLDVTWRDLARDVERAAEFDQTALFRLVYETEFGIAGGEPYGLLLGDYEVRHRPGPGHPTNDVSVLDGIAHVAAASFAPFIAGGSPALLGIDAFRELDLAPDLHRTFEQTEYLRWNTLRRSEDSRFLGVTMPRVLLREPWADDGTRRDGFRYSEDVSEPGGGSWLWGTGVWAVGCAVVRSFQDHGWPAGIRGVPSSGLGGGVVPGLPKTSFATDGAGLVPRAPSDVAVTDGLEQVLSDLGFISLARNRESGDLVIFGVPSIQLPRKFDTVAATANARLSASLQCMLSVSRFAHHLKLIGREKVGSFASPEDCETMLNGWIGKYCTRTEDTSEDERAGKPLAEGRVEVRERAGRPGCYDCVVHLKPHFQVENLVSAVRLVTEFAPIQAG